MLPQLQRMAPLDMLARSEKRETPFGEYLGAALAEGFDYTTTRVMLDELHASREEQRAYGITDNRPQEDDPGDFFSFPEYDPASQFRMSEEDWRKSEHYREGIEFDPRMTPVRARILAEDFDKRRYRDQLVERAPDGYAMLGFGARLLGNIPDPINFIPLGLATRGASTAKTIGTAALEAAAGTLAANGVVLPDLAQRGEDVGWEDGALDIVFAAATGGALGWGGKALHSRRVRRLRRTLANDDRQRLALAQEKALLDISEGRPVDVSEIIDDDLAQRLREKSDLGVGYDKVLADPLGGPADEVLAALEPSEIERVLVERGPAIERNGKIVVTGKALKRATGSKSGFGIVKVIWRHGERSAENLRVDRGDVLRLPDIVRDFEPVEVTENHRVWRTKRADGQTVAYVAGGKASKGAEQVVSIYVVEPGRPTRDSLSQRKSPESQARGFPPTSPDTRTAPFSSSQSGRGTKEISPDHPSVNRATEAEIEIPKEMRTANPLAEETAAMAGEEGLDDLTDELAQVEELRASGRLLPEEEALLREADSLSERAEKYAEGWLHAAACIGGKS